MPAVHSTDPRAKVIYGGQSDPSRECTAGIDVFAYHTYPGYGENMNPETMDYGAYGAESPANGGGYHGIPRDITFWDDEFNSIPAWAGSDESVQSKYIPRGLLA